MLPNKHVADNYVNKTQLGASSGVATLDENGLLTPGQIPAGLDDILNGTYVSSTVFNDLNGDPYTLTTDVIYFDTTSKISYRYSGYFLIAQEDFTKIGRPVFGKSATTGNNYIKILTINSGGLASGGWTFLLRTSYSYLTSSYDAGLFLLNINYKTGTGGLDNFTIQYTSLLSPIDNIIQTNANNMLEVGYVAVSSTDPYQYDIYIKSNLSGLLSVSGYIIAQTASTILSATLTYPSDAATTTPVGYTNAEFIGTSIEKTQTFGLNSTIDVLKPNRISIFLPFGNVTNVVVSSFGTINGIASTSALKYRFIAKIGTTAYSVSFTPTIYWETALPTFLANTVYDFEITSVGVLGYIGRWHAYPTV